MALPNTSSPHGKKLLDQYRDALRIKHRVASPCGTTPRVPKIPTSPGLKTTSFTKTSATQLLQKGHDIRTIQELLGHKDVKTTMIYTHVLQRGGLAVKSPLDG